ncbi:MAG: MFS transporter [Candidatus Aureabacteria bacterium]|nr:MFS transporter [Candidatus Auribacterota bacterium]
MIPRPQLLYAYALIMNSATGVLVVALPLLGIRFGANPLQLGVLGSAGALAYALACPFVGRLSDRGGGGPVGRRRSLMLSCGLLVVVDAAIFLVSGMGALFAIAIAGSFSTAFFWPPLQAWLSEVGERDRLPERLGLFNLSWSLGIMVGPMIGGFLFAVDYRLPWCYSIGTNSLLLTLLLVVRQPAAGEADGAPGPSGGVTCRGDAAEFLPLALWANFACWFCLANIQSLYPKLAVARGFSPQLIGCLLFLVGMAQSAFFIVLRATRAWHFRYGPMVAVHGAAAAGMMVVFYARSVPILSLAFPLIGIGLGLSYYSSIYYSLCGDGAAGKRTGIHELMVGSAFFLGPLAGGFCAQYLGLRSPFLVCALLLAVTAIREAMGWRRASRHLA